MATITYEAYIGAGPAWADIGANTIVFTGTGGVGNPIDVGSYQEETHLGSGDPGTDQCGANHVPNVKWISSTQFDSGSGTETLSDVNLTDVECTMRVHFNHTSSVVVSAARLFSYNPGGAETAEGLNCHLQAFEAQEGGTTWTLINDDSGNIGGDNAGERLTLATKTTALDHYWYIALSLSPETVGNIDQIDLKVYITYS